ncbi:hypothetical protein K1719_041264 [Acacia pycnantha]|nr:hypothetical protein K1719_041264 [Acacia pycnantha]
MYSHQREAFELFWKNLASGIILDQLEKQLDFSSGSDCIISHAPGTGKIFLTIAFLKAFMRRYISCRPTIIAPCNILNIWERRRADDEIKPATSYALGNSATGNLPKYLPFILNQIDNQQKKQYLLFHSLEEIIVRQSADKCLHFCLRPTKTLEIKQAADGIQEFPGLVEVSVYGMEEEGVHNVVAECLGKTAVIKLAKLVPALKTMTDTQL